MKETLRLRSHYDGQLWLHRNRGIIHPMHRHAELEFNLVTRGTGRYILGDRRYDLQRESLVWLFPGQEHVLLDMSPDFEMWIAVFRPGLVWRSCKSEQARTLKRLSPEGSFCRRLAPDRAAWLSRLCAEIAREPELRETYNAALAFLLLGAWEAWIDSTESAGRTLHPAVEQAARLLVNDAHAVNLAVLAESVGLSPSRLSRLFHRQTGVPLVQFRQKQQLERFLGSYKTDGNKTMIAAALDAGFGSYPQFHRVFKARMGSGPADFYRRPSQS